MKKGKLSILLAASSMAVAGVTLSSCGASSKVKNAGEAFQLLSIQDLKDNSSKEKPIEVLFWHSFGQNIETPLNSLIEDFEYDMEQQGIYIDIKAVSTGGGYDGLRSKVNSGIRSSSIPTMCLGYPDHFADYINADILLPLDEFVNSTEEGVGMTGDYSVEDFVDSYWTENLMDTKDADSNPEIVGIPFNKSTEVMYYNASAIDPILEREGWLDENDVWENPTWEQLWTVASELRQGIANNNCSWQYNGATYSADYKNTKYPVYIDSEANFFITTARQWCDNEADAGSVYTTSTSVSEGKVTFDNSITREAQAYFVEKSGINTETTLDDLWNIPAAVSRSYGSALTALNQAFVSIGSTAGVNNNNSQKFEMKITKIPQRTYDNGIQAVIQQGTNAAILTKNSNNLTRLAAWLLIRYITSQDATIEFSKKTGYLPVRESAIASQEYTDFLSLADKDADKTSMDYVKYAPVAKAVAAANSQKSYYYTDPAFKGSSMIRDSLSGLVKSIYVTKQGIDHAYSATYNSLKQKGITCIKEGDE